jgi:hypothetical protein
VTSDTGPESPHVAHVRYRLAGLPAKIGAPVVGDGESGCDFGT